ncbi:MAG TPA: hypothetical protein VLD19_07050, partial [Chitinophagaceae bacterium]|nr:hypothetical protein [Chitinophagaceae bacterium]
MLAQQKSPSYEASWKKVDSLLLKKGLTQSALTEANAIYARAKKEKNEVQAIKALVYRLSLGENINEQDENNSFSLLEKEIATAADPDRSVLLSLLAEKYNG